MYKVPDDIEKQLKTKYPNVKIKDFVHDLFVLIREKAINSGNCLIYGLGSFYTYKTFSEKEGKFLPRFKFRVSRTLLDKLIKDNFVLERIQSVMNRIFDKKKEQNASYIKNRIINKSLHDTVKNGNRVIHEEERKTKMEDAIYEILEKVSEKNEK